HLRLTNGYQTVTATTPITVLSPTVAVVGPTSVRPGGTIALSGEDWVWAYQGRFGDSTGAVTYCSFGCETVVPEADTLITAELIGAGGSTVWGSSRIGLSAGSFGPGLRSDDTLQVGANAPPGQYVVRVTNGAGQIAQTTRFITVLAPTL